VAQGIVMFEQGIVGSRPMSAPLRYSIALLGAYFVAWTVSYVIVMFIAVRRLDFSEYFNWLVLAWTLRGFEMVAITWLFSIAAFIPLAIVAVLLARRLGRRQGRAS
jgi:hypothetical protein